MLEQLNSCTITSWLLVAETGICIISSPFSSHRTPNHSLLAWRTSFCLWWNFAVAGSDTLVLTEERNGRTWRWFWRQASLIAELLKALQANNFWVLLLSHTKAKRSEYTGASVAWDVMARNWASRTVEYGVLLVYITITQNSELHRRIWRRLDRRSCWWGSNPPSCTSLLNNPVQYAVGKNAQGSRTTSMWQLPPWIPATIPSRSLEW